MLGLQVLAAATGGPSASYQPGGAGGMTINEGFTPLKASARKCGWLGQAPFAAHDVCNPDDLELAPAGEDYEFVVLLPSKLEND